jgi:uncharacterized membrane protein YhaH (DUF805 family)
MGEYEITTARGRKLKCKCDSIQEAAKWWVEHDEFDKQTIFHVKAPFHGLGSEGEKVDAIEKVPELFPKEVQEREEAQERERKQAELAVTFSRSVATCFRKYNDSTGRATRAEEWYWLLFRIICCLIALPLGHAQSLVVLVLLPPTIRVHIRRLHDVNLSGWWYLSIFTIIGMFPLLYFLLFKKGDKKTNQYGPDPYHHQTSGHTNQASDTQSPKSSVDKESSEQPKKKEPVKKTEKPQMSGAHDDEKFFEQVATELEEGSRKKGLWLKAETKAEGDADKARFLYIRWRVEQLAEAEDEARRQKEEAELEKELPASEGREFQKQAESNVERINREYREEKRKDRGNPQ